MDRTELETRTKKFALEVIRFVSALLKNKVTNVLGYQLLKSGTLVGANYREAVGQRRWGGSEQRARRRTGAKVQRSSGAEVRGS